MRSVILSINGYDDDDDDDDDDLRTFRERPNSLLTERSPRTFYRRPQRTFVYKVIRKFYVRTALTEPYTTFCIGKLLHVKKRQQQKCDALSKILYNWGVLLFCHQNSLPV